MKVICEIIYKQKAYVVDPLYGKFLSATHLREITPKRIQEIWPSYPQLFNGLEKAKIFVPAMPFDYTRRNQLLSKELKTKGIATMRFGEDPIERLKKWPYQKGDDLRLWDYPLRLLKELGPYKKIYPLEKITD